MSDRAALPIREWPESERPRERILELGGQALSSAELLAILIGSGDRGLSAVDVARRLLQGGEKGDLTANQLSIGSLLRTKGVGPAKAARILAALELGRRFSAAERSSVHRLAQSSDVAKLMNSRVTGLSYELFFVISVDVKNRPITIQQVSRGSAEGVAIQPKEVFAEAVRAGASGIICVHNHPSGDATPSPEDRALTVRLKEGALILGLRFLDHVILANGNSYSFTEKNG